MKQFALILGLILFQFDVFGQTIVFEQDIKLGWELLRKKETFAIVDQETDECSIFVIDNDSLSGYKLDSGFKLLDKHSECHPKDNYRNVLGYSCEAGNIHLLFSNNSKRKFCLKSYPYSSEVSEEYVFRIRNNDEFFVEAISSNNTLYLLTVMKSSNVLNLYEVDRSGLHQKGKFEFSMSFGLPGSNKLYDAIEGSRHQFVDNSVPNPLEIATKKKKIYNYQNRIVLTFDSFSNYTIAIVIDLDEISAKAKYYPTRFLSKNLSSGNSNSYVYDDILYQMKLDSDSLWLAATDLNTDELVNEFVVNKNDEIEFKNSAITQRGGVTDYTSSIERELSTTKQLYRKMVNAHPGLSVCKNRNGVIELTIGSYETINRGHMAMGLPSIELVNFGSFIISFNPVMAAVNSIKSSKAVYVKTLLDPETLEHVKGKAGNNKFENLTSYMDAMGNLTISAETVFKKGSYFYYCYYNSRENKYYIRKF